MAQSGSSYISEGYTDLATVLSVDLDGAVCRTAYGAQITVEWTFGVPSPAPRIGEVWRVAKVARSVWRFMGKVRDTETTMLCPCVLVDFLDIAGSESTVASDIFKMGFQNVYIVVARDGVLAWESLIADDYGLDSADLDLFGFIEKLKSFNVMPYVCIDCGLWGDTDDVGHERYQQKAYIGDELKRVPLVSPTGGLDALTAICEELYNGFKGDVFGLMLSGLGMFSDMSDFNERNVMAFKNENGYAPDVELLRRRSSQAIDDSHEVLRQWYTWNQQSIERMLSSISSTCGGWQIGIITNENRMPFVQQGRCGDWASGLSDDISDTFDILVGTPVIDGDDSERTLSTAYCRRMGSSGMSMAVVDIDNVNNMEQMVEELCRYRIDNMLVNDYGKLRCMSQSNRRKLRRLIESARLIEVQSEGDYIGIYISSQTLDMEDDQTEWIKALYRTVASITEACPGKRLRIYFDREMGWSENIEDTASIVLYDAKHPSAYVDDVIEGALQREDRNIVAIGHTLQYVDLSDVDASGALESMFGHVKIGQRTISGTAIVDEDIVSRYESAYSLDNNRVSEITENDDASLRDSSGFSPLPIMLEDRDCAVVSDVKDAVLGIVGDMVAKAAGRD